LLQPYRDGLAVLLFNGRKMCGPVSRLLGHVATLGSLETRDHFDVVGVRKQVEHLDLDN
jgi:hypothetical protein